MNNKRSPPLTNGKICIISPVDSSPDEMMSSAEGRSAQLLRLAAFFVVALSVLTTGPTQAQFSQQGPKLVGDEAVDPAYQGWSVALSPDGNTAIVGGLVDDKLNGALWVFTRSGIVWTQQGGKLVGTGAVGQAGQGISVALSADGNTIIAGGPYDNRSTGAAWVFTSNGGIWAQQGSKLVGTGAVEVARQGASVALSADGNTALIGGPYDNSFLGAVWVLTRNRGEWSQQGSKLVGTGAVESARQGTSIALSADGNTALVGAAGDNWHTGGAWVYTRNGGVWTQQGSKLVGTGAIGNAGQGHAVALSADGNTAIVGGGSDNSSVGAVWVFTRSGAVWSQGSKLVGTGAVGNPSQGHSVALSADGNTAVVGGPHDNSYTGAVWVFTRNGASWTQQGGKLVGTGAVGNARQGSSVALSADGNTALVGGISDHMLSGAAWVFTRSGSAWTQEYLGH